MPMSDTKRIADAVPGTLPANDTADMIDRPREDATVDYGMDIQSSMLARLHDLWRRKHVEGKLPGRGDFDPAEMKDCLGHIFILEYVPDIDNFRYTLIGTKIVTWLGVDNTGKLVDEVFDDRMRLFYKRLRERKAPVRTTGPVTWRDKEHVSYELIVLPLSEDKRTVNRFIGAMEFHMSC